MTQTTHDPNETLASAFAEYKSKTTNLSDTSQADRCKFYKMINDFICQIEDDNIRDQLEAALKRERSRYRVSIKKRKVAL